MKRNAIVGHKLCACGCGQTIVLKAWHFRSWSVIPKYLSGHNVDCHFKKGNKIGWKGGVYEANGYVYVFQLGHPMANANGYIKRARLVMEETIGRFLQRSEHVHHINGVTNDDSPKNLTILTLEEHLSLHHKGTTQKRNTRGQFMKEVMSNEHSALNYC